jgi:hypothetical protein
MSRATAVRPGTSGDPALAPVPLNETEEVMTENISTYAGYGAPPSGASTTDAGTDASVKDKAAESAQAGKQAASEVAQTAAGQAKQVVGEAQSQARNLVGEARDQLRSHAGDQHRNAVSNLRSLGDELRSMGANSEQGGVASELVTQAADRTHGVADWLDGRQPEDLLEELRRFARRRPGAFLLGALAAGVVAGRLTRGAVAAHSEDNGADTPDLAATAQIATPAPAAPLPPAPPAAPLPPAPPPATSVYGVDPGRHTFDVDPAVGGMGGAPSGGGLA